MSNEDSKSGGSLLTPPPPLSAGQRSPAIGRTKDSLLYIQDTAPAEDVRRSRSSGCWLCGCDGDHDVIPPASTTKATSTPTATNGLNHRNNEVADMAPTLFPPGATAVVEYLRTYGFPTGLCKSLINHEVPTYILYTA